MRRHSSSVRWAAVLAARPAERSCLLAAGWRTRDAGVHGRHRGCRGHEHRGQDDRRQRPHGQAGRHLRRGQCYHRPAAAQDLRVRRPDGAPEHPRSGGPAADRSSGGRRRARVRGAPDPVCRPRQRHGPVWRRASPFRRCPDRHVEDAQHHRDRSRQPPRHRRAGRHEPLRQQGRRAIRPVLRARPVQPGCLLHRRERRRELRRRALPQARLHGSPRDRPGDRHAGRRADLAWRRDRCRSGLRPARRVHGLGGHARHRYQSSRRSRKRSRRCWPRSPRWAQAARPSRQSSALGSCPARSK